MDFNFQEQYKSYSNVELLKITERPGEYQQAAVVAAREVLSERTVSAEEEAEAKRYLLDIEQRQQVKKKSVSFNKSDAVDFVSSVLRRTDDTDTGKWVQDFMGDEVETRQELQTRRWVYIILAVSTLQYLWFLYGVVKRIVFNLHYSSHPFGSGMYLTLFSVVYTPVILYLFYKRKRWGWILEFADKLVPGILVLSQVYNYIIYMRTGRGNIFWYILPVIYSALFVIALWNKRISRYFCITDRAKNITLVVVSSISVLFVIAVYVISYMYQ